MPLPPLAEGGDAFDAAEEAPLAGEGLPAEGGISGFEQGIDPLGEEGIGISDAATRVTLTGMDHDQAALQSLGNLGRLVQNSHEGSGFVIWAWAM